MGRPAIGETEIPHVNFHFVDHAGRGDIGIARGTFDDDVGAFPEHHARERAQADVSGERATQQFDLESRLAFVAVFPRAVRVEVLVVGVTARTAYRGPACRRGDRRRRAGRRQAGPMTAPRFISRRCASVIVLTRVKGIFMACLSSYQG